MLIFGHPEDSWLDGSTNWGIYKKHKPYEIACPQNLSKVKYLAVVYFERKMGYLIQIGFQIGFLQIKQSLYSLDA